MRPFQTGDIVRDQSLDRVLPEHQRDQILFRVIAVSSTTEWSPTPLLVRMADGRAVVQQYLTIERADGSPHFRALVAQEAFTHRGPRYEVVKPVEEVVAEELMW